MASSGPCSMYHAANSRKRSSFLASRPVRSPSRASDEGATFLIAASSATAFSLACLFVAFEDFFDTFLSDLVIALAARHRHECHELMTHVRVDGFSVKKMMILLFRVPLIGTP